MTADDFGSDTRVESSEASDDVNLTGLSEDGATHGFIQARAIV
jgi:hypothetical protein